MQDGLLLGIDLGTGGVKVGLFALTGELLALARGVYGVSRPREGWVEQDPDEWWTAIRAGVRQVLDGQDTSQIAAVAASGQGPTLVLVDGDGQAVRPAISWMDARAEPQRRRISDRLGYDLSTYALVHRLKWVQEEEPEVFQRARWALQAWDLVGCRLAGGAYAASSTHPGGDVWPRAWSEAAGLADSPLLAPRVEVGTAYAHTAGPWTVDLGLPEGIPIVGGLNDGIASLVGADGGVVGRAVDVGGTAGGLGLCSSVPVDVPGVDSWPGWVPGTYVVGGVFAATGGAVEWWARAGGLIDVPAALVLAEHAPAGSRGLVFQPFLAGERNPWWDTTARGSFLGLTFEHGPAEMARAVVEGSAYALRVLIERIQEGGGTVSALRVCGGPARSHFWNAVKADVLGIAVDVPRVTEVSLMGAAVAAAVGAGVYTDLRTASAAMVKVAERIAPDLHNHAVYDTLFPVYRDSYPALKPFYAPLGAAAAGHSSQPAISR